MVLQHAHSFHPDSPVRLDTARIAAGAGAMALNVLVLLVLLVPAGMPTMVAPPTSRSFTMVPIVTVVTPPVPAPTTPEKVEVVEKPRPAARTPVKPDMAVSAVDQVIVENGSLPAEDVVATSVDSGIVDIATSSGPIAGVRLEYADAPSPPYPRDALISGLHGTVMLQVLVDTNGKPLQVDIETSSGHRQLDEAARRFVLKRWSFRPAMKNGGAVQAIGIVPIAFNLD